MNFIRKSLEVPWRGIIMNQEETGGPLEAKNHESGRA